MKVLMDRDRWLGLVGLVVVLAVVALAMNAGRLPVIGRSGGTVVHARFADIGGLQSGDLVELAGVTVGAVTDLELGRGYIRVGLRVRPGVDLGTDTRAAIKVSNLLGNKMVELKPAGGGRLQADIALDHTSSPYDLTTAVGDLTGRFQEIDTDQVADALNALTETFRGSGPDVRASLRGLSAISRTIDSRDEEFGDLLRKSRTLTASLARSRADIAGLLRSARLLLGELDRRREAIRGLIVHTNELAIQLRGLVRDNHKDLTPALAALDRVTAQLERRQKALRLTFERVARFARVFVNTIGNGPWFDSYIGNAPDSMELEDPQ